MNGSVLLETLLYVDVLQQWIRFRRGEVLVAIGEFQYGSRRGIAIVQERLVLVGEDGVDQRLAGRLARAFVRSIRTIEVNVERFDLGEKVLRDGRWRM